MSIKSEKGHGGRCIGSTIPRCVITRQRSWRIRILPKILFRIVLSRFGMPESSSRMSRRWWVTSTGWYTRGLWIRFGTGELPRNYTRNGEITCWKIRRMIRWLNVPWRRTSWINSTRRWIGCRNNNGGCCSWAWRDARWRISPSNLGLARIPWKPRRNGLTRLCEKS